MTEIDDIVLREIHAMRAETDALHKTMVRALELVGRTNEGIAHVRADIATLRADLARVQGDVLLLGSQLKPIERAEHDLHTVILEHPNEELAPEPKGDEGAVDEP